MKPTSLPLIKSLRGKTPEFGENTFIAETAVVVGDVVVGKNSSIWYNAVIRGDVEPIRIGDETNIQDGSTIHATYHKCACTIGNRVTIGHNVILHGCEVGDGTLVGMGTIIMDKAKVGKHCIVGAGSLVTENSQFEDESLIIGRPAKQVRKLSKEEIQKLEQSADNYQFYVNEWYR